MVLIAGKEPALSVAGIIRGELIVINTCVFTAFSRVLIAWDPFKLFGSGEGSYTGFHTLVLRCSWAWNLCWGRCWHWESQDHQLHLHSKPGIGATPWGCPWQSLLKYQRWGESIHSATWCEALPESGEALPASLASLPTSFPS